MKAAGKTWEEIATALRVRVETARDYRARGVFVTEYNRALRAEVASLEDQLYPQALRRTREIIDSDDEHEANTAIKTAVQVKQHRDRMTLSLLEIQAAKVAAATSPGAAPGGIAIHLGIETTGDDGEYTADATLALPPAPSPTPSPGELPA